MAVSSFALFLCSRCPLVSVGNGGSWGLVWSPSKMSASHRGRLNKQSNFLWYKEKRREERNKKRHMKQMWCNPRQLDLSPFFFLKFFFFVVVHNKILIFHDVWNSDGDQHLLELKMLAGWCRVVCSILIWLFYYVWIRINVDDVQRIPLMVKMIHLHLVWHRHSGHWMSFTVHSFFLLFLLCKCSIIETIILVSTISVGVVHLKMHLHMSTYRGGS